MTLSMLTDIGRHLRSTGMGQDVLSVSDIA
jgi:hypothetical protein